MNCQVWQTCKRLSEAKHCEAKRRRAPSLVSVHAAMEAAAFAPSPAAPAPAPVASDTPHSIVSHTMSERSAQLSEHISLWREDIAAQSEQTRMLVEKNAELRQRLREAENSLMQSRVNTSLGDEAAGKARREFAAAAAQKRAERERALRQSNAEMQRRRRTSRGRGMRSSSTTTRRTT